MRVRVNTLLTFFIAAVLLAVPAMAQTGDKDVIVAIPKGPSAKVLTSIDKSLYDYQVFELDLRAINKRVRQTGGLKIYLGNQLFDLELVENDLRAADYRRVVMVDGRAVEQDPGPVVTFKGHVAGDEASSVRLTVMAKLFSGYIKTESDWIFIDPITEFHPGAKARQVVVYNDKAVKAGAHGTCGTGEDHRSEKALLEALPGGRGDFIARQRIGTKAANTIQVATECDGQYWADYGNPGVFNRITGILNDVEGIYDVEIDTDISITYQQCWSSIPGDPYTSLNAETSLFQFRDWWNANRGGTTRDTAHKFSGKNFSGSTIGIAWVGVICNVPSLSYGISQDISGSASRRRLTAHEIGHNLDATHDNQSPVCPGVSCNGNGPIMCSSVQSGGSSAADDFSSCSKDDIDDHISSVGSCL